MWVYWLDRLCARRLGRYPSRSITRWTFACVALLILGLSLSTIETVATDTSAAFATPRMLTRLPAPPVPPAPPEPPGPPPAGPPDRRPGSPPATPESRWEGATVIASPG